MFSTQDVARKAVEDLCLTAVREGRLIPVESQSLVGGLYLFDGLEAMASKLAGFG